MFFDKGDSLAGTMKLRNVAVLPDTLRARISSLVEAKGVGQAAKFLGISRHAMERAAMGATIHLGTAAYLTQQIAARDAEGKNP
jgi:hypothetical protein